ncbi:hypothetical protein [Nocardioides soli]|uniref:Uncharacterized protein n=1 Tax=Nocardioides soli TaxID=1036020 RepID=A0A7W4VTJ7_9ACTN|nr:hypothetical protein [Nocardioides soli]MBB3041233.1 hypothetical protein [Nocardioides soli]
MLVAPLRKSRRAAHRAAHWADLRAVHLSGRYDRSPESLREQLEAAARRADVITVTEVDRPQRGDVLRGLAGFRLLRRGNGQRGESAILVRTAVWEVVAWDAVMLVKDLDGQRGGQVAPIALLRHRATGCTLLVSTTHTSAGVEAGWAASARAREHRDAVAVWRHTVLAWRRRYRPDGELVVADWNLDALRPWVRAWIRSAWPGLTLPKRLPKKGTHGRRLIDWCLTRRIHRPRIRVMALTPASDHRGIHITGTIRPRKEHR